MKGIKIFPFRQGKDNLESAHHRARGLMDCIVVPQGKLKERTSSAENRRHKAPSPFLSFPAFWKGERAGWTYLLSPSSP